jgi:hypothetical protein
MAETFVNFSDESKTPKTLPLHNTLNTKELLGLKIYARSPTHLTRIADVLTPTFWQSVKDGYSCPAIRSM